MKPARLAAVGRPAFATRLGGFSPIATDTFPPRCHAGAAHPPAQPWGAYGELCTGCWTTVVRLLELNHEG